MGDIPHRDNSRRARPSVCMAHRLLLGAITLRLILMRCTPLTATSDADPHKDSAFLGIIAVSELTAR